jgi:hypothetical protein
MSLASHFVSASSHGQLACIIQHINTGELRQYLLQTIFCFWGFFGSNFQKLVEYLSSFSTSVKGFGCKVYVFPELLSIYVLGSRLHLP